MTKSHSIRITVTALVGAVCLAPSALANWHDPIGATEAGAAGASYTIVAPVSPVAQGEAKNVAPFTAPVTAVAPTAPAVPQGEPKSMAPFASPYTDPGLSLAYAKVAQLQAELAGEAKNGPPFTDRISSGTGFHWVDAAVGAAAVLGACLLVLAGLLALRRRGETRSPALRVGHA